MNKKRGVVISTTDNTKVITKSKSDSRRPFVNPLHNHSLNDHTGQGETQSRVVQGLECEELAESNLLSDVPSRMVNQAQYLHRQPDLAHRHENDKCEQNDQQIIESMQKKKELLEMQRRQLQREKAEQKIKEMQWVLQNQKRQKEGKQRQQVKKRVERGKTAQQKLKRSDFKRKVEVPSHKKNVTLSEKVIVKQISSVHLKPKPLEFNVHMLQKMYTRVRSGQQESEISDCLLGKLEVLKPSLTVRSRVHEDIMPGENFNCKKVPFRFQGIL